MKSLPWLFLSVSLSAQLAWAEGPCPAGQRMVGQQNVPGASYPICQTIPAGSAPRQPRAVWADRWGAIASDPITGDVGAVVGHSSRAGAIDAAMRDCSASGGTHCVLKLAYYNQCAAGAWGPGKGGQTVWTGDPYKEGAEKRAIGRCEDISDSSCKLFYSECSYAERVR